MSKTKRHFRAIVAAFAALSVLLLGYAHAPRVQPVDPELAAYVQAGGSLADLCLGGGDGPVQSKKGCPDCQLCKTVVLDSPLRIGMNLVLGKSTHRPARQDALRGSNETRGPPVRGPPAFLV